MDIGSKDNDGVTVLMEAAAAGRTELVRFLLSRASNVNAKDNRGFTALRYARHFADITAILKASGAK